MNVTQLRQQISDFLDFRVPHVEVPFTIHSIVEEDGFTRSLIHYSGREGDLIPAFLLLPRGEGPFTAVLVHHQHHGQRHFGKSEVCGLVGDPLNAFGPALARQGLAVLAPDSICFEDRRKNKSGTDPDEFDTAQHYNELCYRLLQGDTLMRKVLDDSARALSLLQAHPQIDESGIGILGHSYGGNTVLFHAALDSRIKFACSSGAACSYAYKMAHEVGIEMAEVIPGFATRFDISELVQCAAPRRMLLVSATEDKFAMDAAMIFQKGLAAYAAMGESENLEHKRYEGDHALTQERFDHIVDWIATCAKSV